MGRTRIMAKVESVPKKYMSLKEVIGYLGVSEDTVRVLRDSGLIRAFKITNKIYLYELNSIDRFVESRDILRI